MSTKINETFEALSLDDGDCIKAWLQRANYEESNHNVLNLFIWKSWFPIWKFQQENYLVLIGFHEGEYFIYMPLCEKRYFRQAILETKEIFDKLEIKFVMSCFTEAMTTLVLDFLPDATATVHPESADYVYDAEKMRTLSGKKYQKRRNHYNSFIKEYSDRYQYHDLDETWIDGCLELLFRWKNDDPDFFLQHEKIGTEFILRHYDRFDAQGGVIVIDGKVEAFLISSVLSEQMVVINIEKANHQIRGLYQAIEKEFLNRNFTQAQWVNKEDDMGNEMIRKAKRASNPVYLIDKYRISD